MVNRKLFRPALTDVKEQPFTPALPQPVTAVPANARKKPAPPEQTHAISDAQVESQYFFDVE